MTFRMILILISMLTLASCAALSPNPKSIREPAKVSVYNLPADEGGQELQSLLLQATPKVSVLDGLVQVRSITCAGGVDLKPAVCTMRGGNTETGEGNAELHEPYAGTFMKRTNRIKSILFPRKNIYDLQVQKISCDELSGCSIEIAPTVGRKTASE